MSTRTQAAGWRRFVPMAVWLAGYEKSNLLPDVIAALTVWALMVPEAMAYASIAGMPPETGLYAALVAPIAYAIFGTSRQLNVGPSSTVAVLSFSIVGGLAAGSSDPSTFYALTAGLAILTGVFFVVAGLAKLGFLADFMSRPVLDGFVVGLALTIAAGQLHKLFGIDATGDNFFGDLLAVVQNLDQMLMTAVLIGFGSLGLLFLLERVMPRVPAALVVTFLAIGVTSIFDLTAEGLHVIGEIPAGLPSLEWPDLDLSQWVNLVPGAIAIVVVGFAESVAAARTYARKYDYDIDADQEMVALGASNAATGIFGAFVVDGSLSKTAAADAAGQKTQFASVLLFGAVFITILLFTWVFELLPEATLGAIVIHAVWHLIDFDKVNRYWSIRRDDFWAGFAAMVGVLVFGILLGLMFAIAVSFLLLLARAARPRWAILGRMHDEVSDDVSFQDLATHPTAETFTGILIIRFEADLFFANAPVLTDHVRESIEASDVPVRVVLIDAESINDIDSTALSVLREFRAELELEGIEVWVARLKSHLVEFIVRVNGVAPEHTYPSVRSALAAFQARSTADGVDAFDESTTTDDEAAARS
jgi:high affinity sulfate transporter 1